MPPHRAASGEEESCSELAVKEVAPSRQSSRSLMGQVMAGKKKMDGGGGDCWDTKAKIPFLDPMPAFPFFFSPPAV